MLTVEFTRDDAVVYQALVGALIKSPVQLNLKQMRKHAQLVDALLAHGKIDEEADSVTFEQPFTFVFDDDALSLCSVCIAAVPWAPAASRIVTQLLDKLQLEV